MDSSARKVAPQDPEAAVPLPPVFRASAIFNIETNKPLRYPWQRTVSARTRRVYTARARLYRYAREVHKVEHADLYPPSCPPTPPSLAHKLFLREFPTDDDVDDSDYEEHAEHHSAYHAGRAAGLRAGVAWGALLARDPDNEYVQRAKADRDVYEAKLAAYNAHPAVVRLRAAGKKPSADADWPDDTAPLDMIKVYDTHPFVQRLRQDPELEAKMDKRWRGGDDEDKSSEPEEG